MKHNSATFIDTIITNELNLLNSPNKKESCFYDKKYSNTADHIKKSKNDLIKEFKKSVYDMAFEKKLNTRAYLIGFTNGVYDSRNGKFRNGKLTDYLSMHLDYPYVELDDDDDKCAAINKLLRRAMDKTLIDYFMKVLSTSLSKANKGGHICIFVCDRTSYIHLKKIMDLVHSAFGSFFQNVDTMDEIDTKYKGYVLITDEYEISSDIAKHKYNANVFVVCKNLTCVPSLGKGLHENVIVVPLKKNCDTKKYCDEIVLRDVFMSMLVKYNRLCIESGLDHPKVVENETDKYDMSCDMFRLFEEDYLVWTNDKTDELSIESVYRAMCDWYANNYDGECVNMKELRNYMVGNVNGFDKERNMLARCKIKGSDVDDILEKLNDEIG